MRLIYKEKSGDRVGLSFPLTVARNHVNRMCLAADIPLIESGTAGYLGQVTVIKKVGIIVLGDIATVCAVCHNSSR